MNVQLSQANIVIDKVVEQLRKFLIKVYGPSIDNQYVNLRETLQKP